MNWTETINQFQGQGSIFWVAAISMAAGATLLFMSGIVLAKRGLVRRLMARTRAGGLSRREENGKEDARSSVKLTETGYTANPLAADLHPAAPARPSGEDLLQLRERLRKAANSLEEIGEALKNQDRFNGISGLKASSRDVEYVFKTGTG